MPNALYTLWSAMSAQDQIVLVGGASGVGGVVSVKLLAAAVKVLRAFYGHLKQLLRDRALKWEIEGKSGPQGWRFSFSASGKGAKPEPTHGGS